MIELSRDRYIYSSSYIHQPFSIWLHKSKVYTVSNYRFNLLFNNVCSWRYINMLEFSMSWGFWVQNRLYRNTNVFQYEGLKNHKEVARLGIAFPPTVSSPALFSEHSGCWEARPNHSRPNSYKVQRWSWGKNRDEESESLAHWWMCQKLTALC